MVHETVDLDGEIDDWAVFATASGKWCGLPCNATDSDSPPVWSSQGTLCLFGQGASVLDLSANTSVEVPYLSGSPGQVPNFPDSDKCAFVPGTKNRIQIVVEWPDAAPISHWVYNPKTSSSLRHAVPGIRGWLTDGDIAWHSSLKAAAASLYAFVERRQNPVVHLIDAKSHERLQTCTSTELAGGLRKSSSLGPPCIAWSPHGQMLAIVNSSGAVIFSFASV